MKVTVAATQMTCSWEIEENITKAKKIINDAANKGANVILLQELFQTPYFCIEYDEEIFRLAKPFDDNTLLKEMSDIAKKLQVVLPISYFEKDKNAKKIIQETFPDRKIVAINGIDISMGGGNVHCITQQQPLSI